MLVETREKLAILQAAATLLAGAKMFEPSQHDVQVAVQTARNVLSEITQDGCALYDPCTSQSPEGGCGGHCQGKRFDHHGPCECSCGCSWGHSMKEVEQFIWPGAASCL